MAQTSAEHSDGHTEHTGHGGHHVFSAGVLKKTFAILVGLTLLTVVLALIERGYGDFFGVRVPFPQIEFGALSIPIALGIASVKSYFVVSNFMGLKHDNPTYRLVFLGTLVFLLIFFSFTFLDFRFRNTFEELSAVPVDMEAQEVLAAAAEQDSIQAAYDTVPLVYDADEQLFGRTTEAPEGQMSLTNQQPDDGPSSIDARMGLDGDGQLGGGPAGPGAPSASPDTTPGE